VAFVFVFMSGEKINFEDATVNGASTTSIFPEFNGHKIHCQDSRDITNCLNGNKGLKILWLGNSQLHAVNQWELGDKNAIQFFQELLITKGLTTNKEVLGMSQPNANMQEHYLLLLYLQGKIKIDTLVLPLVMDDFREDSIRDSLEDLLTDSSELNILLSKTQIGQEILGKHAEVIQPDSSSYYDQSPHTIVENSIIRYLSINFNFWNMRENIRGHLFTFLYQLRNKVFNITAKTKRKIIFGAYQRNMSALQEILKISKDNNLKILVYVAPIRSDLEIPYDQTQYINFKKDVMSKVLDNGGIFLNLESVIPPDYWGQKDATTLSQGTQEIDYMHFKSAGHRLLAQKIYEALNSDSK